MDFFQLRLPGNAQLRFFFLQLAQFPVQLSGIAALRQDQLVQKHRFQHWLQTFLLIAKSFPRIGVGKTCYRAYRAGWHFLSGLISRPGIDPYLIRFLFPGLPAVNGGSFASRQPVVQPHLYFQSPSRDLHVSQPAALRVSSDLIYPGSKFCRIGRRLYERFNSLQKMIHSLLLQRGTEPARKDLPLFDQIPDIVPGNLTGFQIPLQQTFLTDRNIFLQDIPILFRGKIRAPLIQPVF